MITDFSKQLKLHKLLANEVGFESATQLLNLPGIGQGLARLAQKYPTEKVAESALKILLK